MLGNHELDYSFQILSQMKSFLDRQEYPFVGDIYMYEYTLARAYLQNENSERARKILVKLTKNDTKFIPGYILLTDSYLNKNHLDAAEFILKRAIEKNKKQCQATSKNGFDTYIKNIIKRLCL